MGGGEAERGGYLNVPLGAVACILSVSLTIASRNGSLVRSEAIENGMLLGEHAETLQNIDFVQAPPPPPPPRVSGHVRTGQRDEQQDSSIVHYIDQSVVLRHSL